VKFHVGVLSSRPMVRSSIIEAQRPRLARGHSDVVPVSHRVQDGIVADRY
jgi:hypothetical protein